MEPVWQERRRPALGTAAPCYANIWVMQEGNKGRINSGGLFPPAGTRRTPGGSNEICGDVGRRTDSSALTLVLEACSTLKAGDGDYCCEHVSRHELSPTLKYTYTHTHIYIHPCIYSTQIEANKMCGGREAASFILTECPEYCSI